MDLLVHLMFLQPEMKCGWRSSHRSHSDTYSGEAGNVSLWFVRPFFAPLLILCLSNEIERLNLMLDVRTTACFPFLWDVKFLFDILGAGLNWFCLGTVLVASVLLADSSDRNLVSLVTIGCRSGLQFSTAEFISLLFLKLQNNPFLTGHQKRLWSWRITLPWILSWCFLECIKYAYDLRTFLERTQS